MTILFFLIALGVLIFIHEFGHFIVAKRQGIRIETFSLGFGPCLIGFKWGETDCRLSLLPLGGYVKMLGEDPSEEGALEDPRSFACKSVWQRTKVVAAGPLMNLVLCMVLMPIVFMIGRPQPVYLDQAPVITQVRAASPADAAGFKKGDIIVAVDGHRVAHWESVLQKVLLSSTGTVLAFDIERGGAVQHVTAKVADMPEMQGGYLGIEPGLFFGNEATVDDMAPGGPAVKAGLEKGDRVLKYNGAPVADWFDLIAKVQAVKGAPAIVAIERAGAPQRFTVTPEYSKDLDRWLIGIRKDRTAGVPMVTKQYGPIAAIVKGTQESWRMCVLTLDVLKRLVTFQLSYKVLGGPIIIAKTSAAAAASGLSPFLFFIAFLSMQLAILNLLPIPVLDGGHLFFFGIEAVRRKPLSIKVREIAAQVGFVMLMALMLLVTINDINHVWGIKNIVGRLLQ